MKNSLLTLLFFFNFLTSSFSQVDLTNGLVAYYPFNGDANDASGNGNHAIANNATLAVDRFGNANSAYYFNGIDNYMQIPNAPSINPTSQISLCAFVKPMGFYGGPCHGNSILMKGDADYLPGNYLMRFDDNAYTSQNNCFTTLVDSIHQNFYSVNAQTPPPGYTPYLAKDQWYCLVYTYDGTFGKFYVDGVLINTESAPGLSFSNGYDLFFGRLNHPSYPYWFKGFLDDIRIYNRALNDLEVSAICPSSALPVLVSKFSTSVINKQIRVSWNIENEDDIRSYTVERSLSGYSGFVAMETVIAKNVHSYSFTDNTINVNLNYYYRLAILDKTNTITYSEIKTAKVNERNRFTVVYPNPSKGSIGIKINGYNGKAEFTLINSLGQIVFQKTELVANNNFLQLNLNILAKGIHWLKIQTDNEESVEKIMIF